MFTYINIIWFKRYKPELDSDCNSSRVGLTCQTGPRNSVWAAHIIESQIYNINLSGSVPLILYKPLRARDEISMLDYNLLRSRPQ